MANVRRTVKELLLLLHGFRHAERESSAPSLHPPNEKNEQEKEQSNKQWWDMKKK